jgi:CheY-like chemotaxis protein
VQRPKLKPRIVLIEDDAGRIDAFTRWLEGTEFVLVTARSGGQAMGMLSQGAEGVAGLLLDHDLSDSPLTEIDMTLSASDLLTLIGRNLPRHVPVLIHSHNASKPVTMHRTLVSAGFSVSRIRFATLANDPGLFAHWLDEVRDNWDQDD